MPGLGAFTTVDPLEGTAGQSTVANPYPYAANDALGYIDPLGLSPATNASLQCRVGTMPTSVPPTVRGGYQGEQPSDRLGAIGAATGFGR
jgi:hypothetical protein